MKIIIFKKIGEQIGAEGKAGQERWDKARADSYNCCRLGSPVADAEIWEFKVQGVN